MRTHIWIRKENEAFWNSIENKSEWLNAILKQNNPIGPVSEAVPVLSIKVDKETRYKGDSKRFGKPVSLESIPGVTKGAATKDAGPLYHVLDQNDDTVDTLPLQDAIKLKNSHVGWDMMRA